MDMPPDFGTKFEFHLDTSVCLIAQTLHTQAGHVIILTLGDLSNHHRPLEKVGVIKRTNAHFFFTGDSHANCVFFALTLELWLSRTRHAWLSPV